MAQEGREYLSAIVNSVICVPDAFRIGIGSGKYLFSATGHDETTNEYFAISAIYDSICDVDSKIKYAFGQAINCKFPETIKDYNPLAKPTEQECIAMYHVENIVFRTSILWDLLAQLCNVLYRTGIAPDKVHYNWFFRNHATGEAAIPICTEIVEYLDEEDDSSADTNPWPGNHKYLNDFRNQMTHRVSPNISSISTFGATLRPPVIYVLHRAIEDYYKVSSFLCRLINQYLEDHKEWTPFNDLFKKHEKPDQIEYIELIADNKFKEHIMPIFQKLEKYLDEKTEFSVDLLDEIRALLNDYELRGHISAIIKEAKADKSQILGTYAFSLQSNVTGYIKMENSEQNVRRKKLAKLLLSYINVTRYIVDYNTIEELINRGPQNGEKLVLALGLVNIDEDDIKVNTEIDHIVELSRQNPMYFVIPIYGCSTNVFATINEKTHADIIHIAGHGANCSNGKTVICFTDANMTFDRLCKKIQPPQEIIFLNCCNTYEYVGKKPISIADNSIVHDGSVSASIALDFSDNFYTTFLQTGNLNTAWDAAKSVETPLKYYWL